MTIAELPVAGIELVSMAARIRGARAMQGLNQDDLAYLIGANRNSIANWERGRSEPSAMYFVRLSRVLGVSMEWLGGGVTDARTAPAVARAAMVRPEGFEPPTFCSVVSIADSSLLFLAGLIGALRAASPRI